MSRKRRCAKLVWETHIASDHCVLLARCVDVDVFAAIQMVFLFQFFPDDRKHALDSFAFVASRLECKSYAVGFMFLLAASTNRDAFTPSLRRLWERKKNVTFHVFAHVSYPGCEDSRGYNKACGWSCICPCDVLGFLKNRRNSRRASNSLGYDIVRKSGVLVLYLPKRTMVLPLFRHCTMVIGHRLVLHILWVPCTVNSMVEDHKIWYGIIRYCVWNIPWYV